jgi:hypothetical protein
MYPYIIRISSFTNNKNNNNKKNKNNKNKKKTGERDSGHLHPNIKNTDSNLLSVPKINHQSQNKDAPVCPLF